MTISYTLPIKTISEANASRGWKGRWARGKKQKQVAALLTGVEAKPFIGTKKPIVVTLTKVNPPKCRNLDTDNLASAMKATRDAIAKVIGIDDGSDMIRWEYAQTRGKEHAVHVTISPLPPKGEACG